MDIREFFQKQRWIFAKTYAEFAPHEYIVKGKCNASDAEFVEAMNYILQNGIRMFYYKAQRQYLFLDGYFYWVMRSDENDTNAIINRCKPEDYDIVFMRRGSNKK